MEQGFLDHMYGDLGSGHLESPVAHDDDSVDIYSGLDNSPRISQTAEKSCTPFSPRRLKDSMDLYEEIIKEEQQEKEATCNELKTKLDAAQNHVKELLQKLEQIQLQNTSLQTQNMCLKKNICALFKTARMEILRKDDEISRLTQRGGRGGYCPSFTRSQNNFQRNQDSSQNSAPTHNPAARPENQRSRVNGVPKGLPKPHTEARSVSLHPEPLVTSLVTTASSENSRSTRTDSGVPDSLSDSDITSSDRDPNILQTPKQKGLIQQTCKSYLENNDKPKGFRMQTVNSLDKSRKSQRSEVGDHQDHRGALDASKEKKLNSREKSGKESKQSEKDCMNSSRARHQASYSELHRNLERGKSPPHQRNHSPTTGGSYRTASSSHSQKMRSRDIEPPAKGISRESRSGEVEPSARSSSRESRSGEVEPSAKSSRRESRSRDMEPPAKISSHKSRHSHSRDRGEQNALMSFGREGKHSISDQGRLTNKSSASSHKGSGSPMREHCRKEERSREERNCNRERKGYVTDKNTDCERNKGKDTDKRLRDSNRKVEEIKDKVLQSNVCSKNGTQTTPNTLTTSADCSDLVKKGQEARKGQAQHLALVLAKVPVNNGVEPESSVGHEAGDKILPEEGNRNRKLSFMETLNLTLSPVKKSRLSSECKEQESGQYEDIPEGPHEETSQFHLEEEFCVIDELDSNEISKEMDEVFEAPAANSSEICEAEKGQGPLPGLELNNVEKENERGKEEGLIKTHISSMKTKCDSESIVDENTVLQSADRKLPTASVDQRSKLTASQEPIDSQGSGSTSEMVDGDVMTALLTESLNCATEGLTGASVVHTVQMTDDIHMCSSNSEGRTSLECESPSVKSVESVAHDPAIVCVANCSPDSGNNAQLECQKIRLAVLPESISQDAATSVPVNTHPRGDRTGEEACDVSTDAVSSTVSIEVVSQSTDSVVPSIVETVVISSTEAEKYIEKSVTNRNLTTPQSAEMPKVSSTFRDETVQSEQGRSGSLQVAPDCCISEPDSTEDEEWNNRTEPSSSVPLAHDEDSMMLTLKNIQLIPEAISPLTSPIRPVKKNLPHCSGNAQHVRSLSKEDFSSLTGVRRMDVNKENEKPHCSSTQFPPADSNQTLPSPSSRSEDDNELEEGEIVSDSEEEEPPVIPSPQLRKTQTVTASKMQPSPKSPRLAKKQAQKAAAISQGHSGMKNKTTSTPNNSPSSNKKHKTVLPLLPKTDPSSISDVMDMLKLIQTHLRKKYMKFHKNLPKKLFSSIIDMSLCSFTDFVNNVSFSKFCSLESILKPKLNRIISVTMSKISNNGIVNRIFEQQSPSLKKKLWTFVEEQFEFLFREIQTALTSLCNPAEVRHFSKTENKVERNKEKKVSKVAAKPPVTTVPTLKKKAAEVDLVDVSGVQNKVKPPTITPHRTGLGSRGKNLKMNREEDDQPSEAHDLPSSHSPSKTALSHSKNSSSGEKSATFVRRLSHSSVQDKSDFEILTEQQASSLTFNLVTDSQMGEIFKCLLQGSDLLENSVSIGDAHCWPVGTPRKDTSGGESSLVVMTPNKTTLTPSKVIATWSTISPCKLSSPNPKMHIPLNPAILDESCLLEVPSSSLPFCKETPSSTVPSQRSYSVLAEDLAVSLTIPSPLKSDGHLSFLHPEGTEPTSAPESVISAHYSEDALMDGEDATEQDIHLALDSDNSSAGSSGCRNWEDAAAVAVPTFQFKPHLPMQAVVMEKSNDHFIVRIRHTSTSIATSPDQNATSSEKESQKVVGARVESMGSAHSIPDTSPNGIVPGQSQRPASCENPELHLQCEVPLKNSLSGSSPPGKTVNCPDVNAAHSHEEPVEPPPTNSEIAESASPSELVIMAEEGGASKKSCVIRLKRKKHHSQPRAKRVKMEHTQEKAHKQRKKNSSSGSKNKGIGTPRKKRNKTKSPPLSPNSLSAKNVIRKKGEVVVTWTRDEDRDILIELKKKGASPDTFTALSAKMNKPPALIAERFFQLMKLFKKKEKMDS
ncbi:CASP8-associated protein 2 isoform X1 [Anguilla anguilla]|uniref:CASP8-associated protein 2 isoform X1 n=1 Tax=Anguilla anguilla TaxID=7936 RepID=UPI0015ADE661|nr:CASP8-associated protein 2 isoform X1 [Anguilla anguilla]